MQYHIIRRGTNVSQGKVVLARARAARRRGTRQELLQTAGGGGRCVRTGLPLCSFIIYLCVCVHLTCLLTCFPLGGRVKCAGKDEKGREE